VSFAREPGRRIDQPLKPTMKLLCLFALAAALYGTSTRSQDYPSKPVRIVVAFSAGASTDILARLVAQRLTEAWGQNVLVENRAAGAGGTVGTAYVAKAAPDGYTLLMANNSTHTVAPHLYRNAGYDPIRDFAPVSLTARVPLLLTVHPSLPVRDVKGFIELARKRPGHLAGALFKWLAKVDMTHVPYKGAGAAIVDLIAGQVQVQFAAIPTALPYIRQERLRPLGRDDRNAVGAFSGAADPSRRPHYRRMKWQTGSG
jgi:tripartite-type tricarboxylate transporter receptor subunit TctC